MSEKAPTREEWIARIRADIDASEDPEATYQDGFYFGIVETKEELSAAIEEASRG